MFNNRWSSPEGAAGSGAQSNTGAGQQATASQQAAGSGQQAATSEQALEYEAWVKDQPKNIKDMLGKWEGGLKTALESERGSRKDLEKQLRDLAKKAEDGSDAQKKLVGMADQVSAADRRADFYEEAHKAGVSNIKLAFLVATEEDLFDSKNRVNFDAMKKEYPELFGGKPVPEGNAGNGTEGAPQGVKDMNKLIRQAAGRST
jgi:hypothetical protein